MMARNEGRGTNRLNIGYCHHLLEPGPSTLQLGPPNPRNSAAIGTHLKKTFFEMNDPDFGKVVQEAFGKIFFGLKVTFSQGSSSSSENEKFLQA